LLFLKHYNIIVFDKKNDNISTMRVIQYTVPDANEFSVTVQEDILPYFYNYLHCHKEAQISLILKGEGTLIVGNYSQSFRAGEIYFIAANQPHQFVSRFNVENQSFPQQMHAIHIFLDHQHTLSSLLRMTEFEHIRTFLINLPQGLQVPEQHAAKLSSDIEKIKNRSGLKRLLKLIEFLEYCEENIKDWKNLSASGNEFSFTLNEGVRMKEIYNYTLAHHAESISLDKISSIACMTPHAFCKYFKKHTRKTYFHFLNEVRINESCKKITKENFSGISSVAYSTGFSSIITFNRVFKKITGMSPSDYIKTHRMRRKFITMSCFLFFLPAIVIDYAASL